MYGFTTCTTCLDMARSSLDASIPTRAFPQHYTEIDTTPPYYHARIRFASERHLRFKSEDRSGLCRSGLECLMLCGGMALGCDVELDANNHGCVLCCAYVHGPAGSANHMYSQIGFRLYTHQTHLARLTHSIRVPVTSLCRLRAPKLAFPLSSTRQSQTHNTKRLGHLLVPYTTTTLPKLIKLAST